MSTNNNKLLQGYTIRIARSSDIFKIYILFTEETLKGGIQKLIFILCLPQIFMFVLRVWDISSLITSLASTLLSFSLTYFVFYIIYYLLWSQIINNKQCLIICYKNKVCGFLIASNYQKYSYIKSLFIGSRYRRKGLATYLIKRALDNLKYPIYLLSIPKNHLFDFYTGLGFVLIKEHQLPKELKKYLSNVIRFFPMILEEK